ncbi:MAG: hypothetical protein ACREH8_21500 [Opitutaceae bacterium]
MRQRLKLFFMFFAWFMATGSQWDLAQVVAWSRMFAGYSQDMSLSAAAQKTFSGEMCDLCQVVQKGKQAQDTNGTKAPELKVPGKLLDLGPISAGTTTFSPVRKTVGIVAVTIAPAGRGRAAPPSPPPRVLA